MWEPNPSMASYDKKIISIDEKERLFQRFLPKVRFERKADINGCCIKFSTDNEAWRDSWDENWFFISEDIKSHGKIMAMRTGQGKARVLYDPISRSLFFLDCDYYGWIKSSALALAGDILEDNHNIFSIHGACLDANGKGLSIIGPAGTGKTTLSYGLLRYEGVKLVSDDWHFFNFANGKASAYGSEKNTYIKGDITTVWKEYKSALKGAKMDNRGRAILNVRQVIGKANLRNSTTIDVIILLRREKGKDVIQKLSVDAAVRYMEANDYCNQHLLQHNAWKKKVRRIAFRKLFKSSEVWLINTVESPQQTLSRICEITGVEKNLR
jgi:adenylate kinase family enzyme